MISLKIKPTPGEIIKFCQKKSTGVAANKMNFKTEEKHFHMSFNTVKAKAGVWSFTAKWTVQPDYNHL